jgi:enterochelin esterase-like enzyme
MNFWQTPIETLSALMQRKAPLMRQIRHRYTAVLNREVDIDIYLPPDYQLHPGTRYPWLILNDGQDLPRMQFSKILEKLYYARQIPQIIVIGIHAGPDRIREYGTMRQPDYQNRGDRAPQYGQFLTAELIPYLQSRFRLSTDREDAIIAGFSLGALSAFDLAWAYPQIFGAVGVFSGALWWRWEPVNDQDPDASRILHDIVATTQNPPANQYYWFQTGTLDEEDDRNNNGVIDSIDDTLDLIRTLQSKGIPDGAIRYYEMEGGRHEPATWGEAMPDFLKWSLNTTYLE